MGPGKFNFKYISVSLSLHCVRCTHAPEAEIYVVPQCPGLGGEHAVAALAPVRAGGCGTRAPGGPPLPQQLGVKVGMSLGVFTETKIKS